MALRVYLSFDESDRETVEKIAKYAQDPLYESLQFKVCELFKRWETESVTVIQNLVSKKLKNSSRVIVLVGENTHKSLWVKTEVDLAEEFKIPVYAIKLKETEGETPECLVERGIKVREWNVEVLQYLATK